MNRRLTLCLFLMLTVVSQAGWAADWLIRSKDSQQVEALALKLGLQVVKRYEALPWTVVRAVPATRAALDPGWLRLQFKTQGLPAVPDSPITLASAPNDPFYPDQVQFNPVLSDADIHAPAAWSVLHDSGDVVVAVIDSGVDADHPDLVDNLWINEAESNGVPGVDDDNNGYVDDVNGWNVVEGNGNLNDTLGHGTRVAGVIGARGDNSVGLTGLCWRTRMMPLRAFASAQTNTSLILDAVDYLVRFPAVRIVNASWGDTQDNQPLQDAMELLRQRNILVVAASGNNGVNLATTPFYPAAYDLPHILSVASIGQTGTLAGSSNYGPEVSVAAPGEALRTTDLGGAYNYHSGTSYAAPLVTAAAALLLAQRPGLTPYQVRQRMIVTSRKTNALTSVPLKGGLLDVGALLQDVLAADPAWLQTR